MDLPPQLLQFGGPVVMLVGLYWMLATDRLVTGATHRRALADKDAQIAKQDKAIEVKDGQIQKLRSSAKHSSRA